MKFNIFKRNQKSRFGRKYNLKRDDACKIHKTYRRKFLQAGQPLPPKVDNSTKLPPCWNQGNWGTCYAHAIAGAVYYEELMHMPTTTFMPSRLGIAYNACTSDGGETVKEEDGVMSLYRATLPLLDMGFFPEAMFDYIPANLDVPLPDACVTEGKKHLGKGISSIDNTDLNSIKTALADGKVIIFGMLLYGQYESDQCMSDGIVSTPGWWTKKFFNPLGGHAQLIVGYDDTTKTFLVRGSWADVADKGYFHIGYDYLTDSTLAFDFVILDAVAQTA